MTIQFWSDAPYVNAGQCTTLHWNVEGLREVYLNGSPVAGQGSQQVCLCEAATYTLHVIKVDGSTEDRRVFIDVYCQFYGQATPSDPSGVSWAQFYYSINGEGPYSVWMQDIGGGLWQTEVFIWASTGIGMPAGTVQYYVVSSDSLGNQSTSYAGKRGFHVWGNEDVME